MRRKSFVFILAFLGIISAFWAIKRGTAPPLKLSPANLPPEKPYPNTIAASGIIEAIGDNICVGSPTDGVVQEVYVEAWQKVKVGDPLFKLDSRELNAELKVAEAKEKVAKAEHRRADDQFARLCSVKDTRAISQEELRLKENEVAIALAKLEQASQEKDKIVFLIDRLTVRSPINGVVLQKNIRVGEYLLSSNVDHAPIIVGDVSRLQIRADIDEQNASSITTELAAIAYPKNRLSYAIPLLFVRIEPYVIPKVSLTGSSREKIDTRILQIIYSFDPPQDISLYVGQQVDIYLKQNIAEAS